MIEKQQDRMKWKTNPRGKTKRKTKQKNSCEAILSLQVKAEKYSNLEILSNEIGSALQLPTWTTVKGVDTSNNSLSLRVASKSSWDAAAPHQTAPAHDGVHLMASMFLSLYQGLNLCRAIQKSQSA